jgi:hypothetical protein
MGRQSAADYVGAYHNLFVTAVNAKREKLTETVHVTRYQVRAGGERSKLLNALAAVLGLERPPSLSTAYDRFYFPKGDVIGSSEPFFWQSIRRAFGFKASPSEMRDVLRLAVRCGRIGTGKDKDAARQAPAAPTMAIYASRYFGQDCNGFVGNYWGLSPEVNIGSWAQGTEAQEAKYKENENGWVRAAMLSLPYIPLHPRRSAADAQNGDVLIDVENGSQFPHIAVIENVLHEGGDKLKFQVVEWGSATSLESIQDVSEYDKHVKAPVTKELVEGGPKQKEFGVGYKNGSRYRYLFAAPDVPFPPATWGRCGKEEI